jgi:hypothetical protein
MTMDNRLLVGLFVACVILIAFVCWQRYVITSLREQRNRYEKAAYHVMTNAVVESWWNRATGITNRDVLRGWETLQRAGTAHFRRTFGARLSRM